MNPQTVSIGQRSGDAGVAVATNADIYLFFIEPFLWFCLDQLNFSKALFGSSQPLRYHGHDWASILGVLKSLTGSTLCTRRRDACISHDSGTAGCAWVTTTRNKLSRASACLNDVSGVAVLTQPAKSQLSHVLSWSIRQCVAGFAALSQHLRLSTASTVLPPQEVQQPQAPCLIDTATAKSVSDNPVVRKISSACKLAR